MIELVFFLEELSAKVFLDEFLPRWLPSGVHFKTISHQGKSDLQRSLPRKLRAWQNPNSRFVVLHDKDGNDCSILKMTLRAICSDARSDVVPVIRIACHELESWYLGDLDAVQAAFPNSKASSFRGRAKFRDVDELANAAEELPKLAPEYQKVGGSRKLGSLITPETNRSHSFSVFLAGVRSLLAISKVDGS